MHIQCGLALPELWEEGDGSLEVLRTGTGVVLEVFEVSDSGFLGDCFRLLLVLGKLGIYAQRQRDEQ